MVFLENALMCIIKKVSLINHDCLPILMLLYTMLCTVLAYLMLCVVLAYLMLAALSNADCLYNAFVSCFVLVFLTHSLLISNMIFHHAQCY